MIKSGSTWVARGVADAAAQVARTLPEGSPERAYCEGVHDVLRHFTFEGPQVKPALLERILAHFDTVSALLSPQGHSEYDDRPAVIISRGQLSEFAGRALSDEEIERMNDAWPNSSIPEALGTIADSVRSTDAATARVAAAILKLYPSATRYGVTSSDQGNYGYLLTDVGFEDGTLVTHDSGTFSELADQLDSEELGDLSWGAFGDRDADASFDVDITTGQIIR